MTSDGQWPATDRCGARTRSDTNCRRPAGWGTDHPGAGNCKLHGGASPNGRIHAQRILAAQAVATYGLPRDIDPAEALLEEVARTAGHVAWLGSQIAAMEARALVTGTQQIRQREAGETTERTTVVASVPAVWLELYQRERRHLVDVCRAALAAGVQERYVRLAEQQGQVIVQILRGVLSDLGLADRPDVDELVARRLRHLGEAS